MKILNKHLFLLLVLTSAAALSSCSSGIKRKPASAGKVIHSLKNVFKQSDYLDGFKSVIDYLRLEHKIDSTYLKKLSNTVEELGPDYRTASLSEAQMIHKLTTDDLKVIRDYYDKGIEAIKSKLGENFSDIKSDLYLSTDQLHLKEALEELPQTIKPQLSADQLHLKAVLEKLPKVGGKRPFFRATPDNLKNIQEGQIYELPAFLLTTLDPSKLVRKLIKSDTEVKESGILVIIGKPTGIENLVHKDLSHQRAFVFLPDTKFEVVKIEGPITYLKQIKEQIEDQVKEKIEDQIEKVIRR